MAKRGTSQGENARVSQNKTELHSLGLDEAVSRAVELPSSATLPHKEQGVGRQEAGSPRWERMRQNFAGDFGGCCADGKGKQAEWRGAKGAGGSIGMTAMLKISYIEPAQ